MNIKKDKKVFGIDITATAVSFAELERTDKGVSLLRSEIRPLAKGVVVDGVVQDVAAVVECIKEFKGKSWFNHINAGLSVCSEPVLLQIFTLPECSPGEVKKVIQNEIRQYAILPLKNIEFDYCSLKTSDTNVKKMLVGATQSEHLTVLMKAIEKHHIDVRAVEPAILAFLRVCYSKVVKRAGDKNIMFVLVRDENLTLCILKRQKIEFLRTKKSDSDIISSAQRNIWLKNEIESVMQFCDIEQEAAPRPWQVVVAAGCDNQHSGVIAEELKKELTLSNVEISGFNKDMTELKDVSGDCLPPVAVGAAFRLLCGDPAVACLELVPKEITAVKKARREMMVIVNAAACLMLLIFVYIAFLSQKSAKMGCEVYNQKNRQMSIHMQDIVKARSEIDRKMQCVNNSLKSADKVIAAKDYRNWSVILTELVKSVPQNILIQNLESKGNDVMEIDGLAVDYDSVNVFVKSLSRNKLIGEASLMDAGKDVRYGSGYIGYKIVCSLSQ